MQRSIHTPRTHVLSLSVLCLLASPLFRLATAEAPPKLAFEIPPGWAKEEVASKMRYAQFQLPKSEGDKDQGSMTIYFFGSGQGGSVDANLKRWIAQMTQPDGSSSQDKAETTKKEFNGMKATLLKLNGTYTPPPFMAKTEGGPKEGYRMLAAVLETKAGPFFFKAMGPEKALRSQEDNFEKFLASVNLAE